MSNEEKAIELAHTIQETDYDDVCDFETLMEIIESKLDEMDE